MTDSIKTTPLTSPEMPPQHVGHSGAEQQHVGLQQSNIEDPKRTITWRRFGAASALVVSLSYVGLAIQDEAPHPPVSHTIPDALISANKGLHNVGEDAFIVGGLVFGAATAFAKKRPNSEINRALITTRADFVSASIGIGVSLLLAGTAASGSALGATAGAGANEPLRFIADTVATSPATVKDTVFVVQDKYVTFGNHSEVSQSALDAGFTASIGRNSGRIVQYSALFGYAGIPNTPLNPSSTLIALLPAEAIQKTTGIDLSSNPNECLPDANGPSPDCPTINVIANQQLAGQQVEAGKAHKPVILNVDNQVAEVVQTEEVYPGLDRGDAAASLEVAQADGLTSKDTVSGAVISGLTVAEVQDLLRQYHLPYAAIDYPEFSDRVSKFFHKAIDPSQMQYLGELLALGIGGIVGSRLFDVHNRRVHLASDALDGVTRPRMAIAEFIRAGQQAGFSTLLSAPVAYELIAGSNQSVFGLDVHFGLAELGTGLIVVSLAQFIGAAASSLYVLRANFNQILRGN